MCSNQTGFNEDATDYDASSELLDLEEIGFGESSIGNMSSSESSLTADEASLVMREAPLPVQNTTQNTTQNYPQKHYEECLFDPTLSYPPISDIILKRCPCFCDVLRILDCPDSPSIADEKWVEIATTSVVGFVGVTTTATITVTTLSDSLLTAKFEFDTLPNDENDLAIELLGLPLLLPPTEAIKLTLNITSKVELDRYLSFTVTLKDVSTGSDLEQEGRLEVSIKMPTLQTLFCDGVNKVTFPPMQEKSTLTKYFVLTTDCCEPLQLELSIAEEESMFVINSVQYVNDNYVSKALRAGRKSQEDGQINLMMKRVNKQLCRVSNGNAIKVEITFVAPKLQDLRLTEAAVNLKGTLNVKLFDIDLIVMEVNLFGSVGRAALEVHPPTDRLCITHVPTIITLCNVGSAPAVWTLKFRSNTSKDKFPFKVSANELEIAPGNIKELSLAYTGPSDAVHEGILILEETFGNIIEIEITGCSDKSKAFPIIINHKNMSWVQAGMKEVNLQNSTNRKVQIQCQIVGNGFLIAGVETSGTYILTFEPGECRPLPIVFCPRTPLPHEAALLLVFDINSNVFRKVKLQGSAHSAACWLEQLTYRTTALVWPTAHRLPLVLYNCGPAPVFVYAQLRLNLQFRFIGAECRLEGASAVLQQHAIHSMMLSLPWGLLRSRARVYESLSFATVTVLTGPEFLRRRILKVFNESNGELNASLLPDYLRVIAEPFDGEDPTMDVYLHNFHETKDSLNTLIGGLLELTAQVDLPQEFEE